MTGKCGLFPSLEVDMPNLLNNPPIPQNSFSSVGFDCILLQAYVVTPASVEFHPILALDLFHCERKEHFMGNHASF